MDSSVKLCMGCMNELDANGVCHYCSYTDDIPHLQSYLAPRTVLDNRYIVGKMLSYNGEGASYICYDIVRKTKAVVREYMPDTLCERESGTQNIVVNPDCLAKYKTYMLEFADMYKVLSRMKNLNHISTAMDMFSENNTTYVVLDYVEGVSLKKFLYSNKGFLSWPQVKKLFVPIFTTLSIIHNAGIIHRGISPENIIVTTDGELTLTGFCTSSVRTLNTGLIPEFYSGYTAPEQYTSLDYQGTWTDVYAVAAVIYRILTAVVPLDAKARMNNDTLMNASQLNPDVPNYVSKVLAHAMAVKGEVRIQSINELVTQLFGRPNQMQHQKGATQTIPIQKAQMKNQNDRVYDNNYDENLDSTKKMKPATLIAGIIVLALFLGLGIFLLSQLLFSSDNDSSNDSFEDSFVFDDSEFIVNQDSSEEIEIVVTTAEEQSPYGVGSIMPNLVGMRYDGIIDQIGDEFTIRPDYFYSDSVEKGQITEQSIPAESDYDPELKNELVLKVCKGAENVAVPDYSGLAKKDYLAILDSLNIKYKIVNVQSSYVPEDYVESTSIDVGSNINVKNGDVLTVKVSSGIRTTTITTPQQTEKPEPDVQSEEPEEQNQQLDD